MEGMAMDVTEAVVTTEAAAMAEGVGIIDKNM
jgi:hypothetical protein